MKPSQFRYEVAESADHAVASLREHGPDAKLLAGGQSLVPLLALRMTRFDRLIDLGRIVDLQHVVLTDDAVEVGAMVRQAHAERSPDVQQHAPLLARALPLIGHFQIRNMGTVGGSLAHADPASELPAVALALGAEFEIAGHDDGGSSRTVSATDFFRGFWHTAVAEDELLLNVRFPIWKGRSGFAIEEFSRRAGDFALTGAAVALTLDDDDAVARVGIALFGLGATALRGERAERDLLGVAPSAGDLGELSRLAVADTAPQADLHGSAEFRRELGAVVVEKSLGRALAEARRG